MATFPTSYVSGGTIASALKNAIALDLDGTAMKAAMFTNTLLSAGDKNAAETFGAGAWTAGTGGQYEVATSPGDYATGGQVIASPTLTAAAGVLTYDSTTDRVWTGVTWPSCQGVLVHDSTGGTNLVICAIRFTSDLPVTGAGTFTLTWDPAGIWTATY